MKILLVDDEPLIIEELQDAFELEGHDIESANCVPDALDVMENEAFDAVITDLKMPGTGGLVLLEKVKKTWPETKVVVVSGHGAQTNKEEALRLGADAIYAKPVDLDVLLDTVAGN